MGETPGDHRVFLGPGTREWRLLVADCPALAAQGMLGLGITEPGPHLRIGGDGFNGGTVVISLGGSGSCRVGGRWRRFPAGRWYQVPPLADYGYRPAGGPWILAWLSWAGDAGPRPPLPVARLIRHPVEQLRHLLEALRLEADPRSRADLVRLIDRAARQACGEASGPLDALWAQVEAHPERPWTLPGLCRFAGMSEERLRRASLRATGRSPMHQVAALRLRLAAARLAAGAPVAAVAGAVGYRNPFAFAAAFRRLYGVPPSRLLRQDLAGSPAAAGG